MFTHKDLQDLLHHRLKDHRFVVAANREPYIHSYSEDGITVSKPAGGLVVALDPVLRASKGVWIAYGSGEADRAVADAKGRLQVPPDNPQYTLRRIWLSKKQVDGFYDGVSNGALWPLCHIAYVRPQFHQGDWEKYVEVNRMFADAILEEISDEKAFVWVHDYHLTLVSQFVKEKRPDVTVAQFWHIPWPNPEVFRICPWKEEILRGLLANDLIGFHVRLHCDNFLQTVDQTIECRIDRERSEVIVGGSTTSVQPFPISVDVEEIAREARGPRVEQEIRRIKKMLHTPAEFIAVGADRIDYTKGIPERLRSIDRFLEKYPQYIGRFVYLSIGAPSRTRIKEYKDLIDDIADLTDEINWKYRTDGWQPIVYLEERISYPQILAYYRMADVCIVSALHDGMNLVAKEYIASQVDKPGALVLSQFTGAARELTQAILTNPFHIEETADAIHAALSLSDEEKTSRLNAMKEIISENNIYMWAAKFISELTRIPNVG